MLGKGGQNFLAQTRVGKLTRGNVDCNRRHAQAGIPKSGNVGAGHGQHALSQFDDEPAILGHRDEFHRRHHAAHRMLPANQGLDAG